MADTEDQVSLAQTLGMLSGELRIMHQSITESMSVIREDLRRADDAHNERLARLEDNIKSQFDGMNIRITGLEKEEKQLAVKVAQISSISGLISAILTTGAVELIKRSF
jgi:hypothetical protein